MAVPRRGKQEPANSDPPSVSGEGGAPGHDIVVIGASAGGVEAMSELARGLPADLPAALFLVHHFPAHGTSVLPAILNRRGPLPAEHAWDGQAIRPGRIYVAPPDRHMLLKRGTIHLSSGPRENGHRPAIDPLFRSAGRAYGPRVVGVVLSGTLDDGTAGLHTIKRRGGVAVAQDPNEALYSSMPRSAIENVPVDHILKTSEIVNVLARLAREPVREELQPVSDELEMETEIADLKAAAMHQHERSGTPSGFACPDCGGALWELTEDNLFRFRCRVGHAYTADSLLEEQSEALEAALWTALRALEESAALSQRLLERARKRGSMIMAERFGQQEHLAEQRAEVIRQILLNGRLNTPEGEGTAADE